MQKVIIWNRLMPLLFDVEGAQAIGYACCLSESIVIYRENLRKTTKSFSIRTLWQVPQGTMWLIWLIRQKLWHVLKCILYKFRRPASTLKKVIRKKRGSQSFWTDSRRRVPIAMEKWKRTLHLRKQHFHVPQLSSFLWQTRWATTIFKSFPTNISVWARFRSI